MNKRIRHPLLILARVLLAAAALCLTLGPALSAAVPVGPACMMPCCLPPVQEPAPHDPAMSAKLADCCPSLPSNPCDLNQVPAATRTVTLTETSCFSAAGLLFQVLPRNATDLPGGQAHRYAATTVSPSFTPPLFLTKSALLR